MIRDQNIDYIRKRLFIGPFDFNALITPAVTAGAGSEAFGEGELLQNPTSSGEITAPDINLKEIGSTNIVGLGFSAAGDIVKGSIKVPYDLDPKWPVGFRVNFTNNNASAGTATFILLVEPFKKDVAFSATVDNALDTVIGISASTAQLINKWTGRGIKRSIGFTRQEVLEGARLGLSLELDAVATIAATDVVLLGLEMDYVPAIAEGNGCLVDRALFHTGKNT